MTRVTLLAISLTALLSACGASGDSAASNSMNVEARTGTVAETQLATTNDAYSGPAEPVVANTATTKPASVRQNTNPSGAVPTRISLNKAEETYTSERKVIRNAELNLEADDPEAAQRKITSIAELRGGFVVESQQSSSEIRSTTRDIVTMTVRVPADKFGDALADIRNVSTRVIVETVKGQDVTEEFIDIEAQLKANEALEQQFMEIMKRANTVGDALHVQSQLADVRGEIERIEGRKRFLENQSAMSTIKVRLQTAKVIAATSVGIGGRLADSFAAGADVAIGFVLGLVTVVIAALPFAIFVGLPVFVLFRYVLRRHSRARSVIDFAEDELKRT